MHKNCSSSRNIKKFNEILPCIFFSFYAPFIYAPVTSYFEILGAFFSSYISIPQYKLIKDFHVSAGQLSRMRKNQYISIHTVDVLCNILDCQIEDVMIFSKTIAQDK